MFHKPSNSVDSILMEFTQVIHSNIGVGLLDPLTNSDGCEMAVDSGYVRYAAVLTAVSCHRMKVEVVHLLNNRCSQPIQVL
jgi:hypothetical protein